MCLLWLPLLLLVAGSCTQADVEEENIPPHALKDVEASFNLHVLASSTPVTRSITFTPEGTIDSDSLTVGVKDSLQTKADQSLTPEVESRIVNLWVGQFHAGTGNLIFSRYINSVTDNKVTLKLKQNEKNESSNIWFVANLQDLETKGDITTEANLKQLVLDYSSTGDGLPNPSLCGMVGKLENQPIDGTVKNLNVELTRLIAKITFTYKVGAGFSFEPKSVTLKSVPTKYQIEAPTAQLAPTSGIGYTDYTGKVDNSGTTPAEGVKMYWYLPENMAGTADGSDGSVIATSFKDKIGNGVTNATYIELTGRAEQNGVTFENVTFRFYLGRGGEADYNNYDIIRNHHYNTEVTLIGIDASDKRITVGTLPSVDLATGKMGAAKGSDKQLTIIAQPGVKWQFEMPDWLSTMIGNSTLGPSMGVSHQGPYKLTFVADNTNPKEEERKAEFTIKLNEKDTTVTIIQEASSLTASVDKTTLAATAGDDLGTVTFQGTPGLPITVTTPGWITLTRTISGETTGEDQTFEYKTNTVNLDSTVRTAENISVTAGQITKTVAIKQSGSIFTVDRTEIELENTEASGSVEVTGTKGLPWTVSPPVRTKGITPSITSDMANGNVQTVTFSSTVNKGAAREVIFTIAVTGGNHSKEVKVKQKADVSNTVTIDQDIVDDYRLRNDISSHPPFNYDNGNVTGNGSDYKGNSYDYTISTPYTVEVESTQSSTPYRYDTSQAKDYCTNTLGADWRLPTMIELFAMWAKCKGTNNDATDDEAESTALGAKFLTGAWYWTGTVTGGHWYHRSLIQLSSGTFNDNTTGFQQHVRCVRDL